MYHDKKPNEKPSDKKDEKKLLTKRSIEKGPKTTKSEKRTLMGSKKKSVR